MACALLLAGAVATGGAAVMYAAGFAAWVTLNESAMPALLLVGLLLAMLAGRLVVLRALTGPSRSQKLENFLPDG